MSFKLTDFITVTSTGNVGIGTTSPNRNLSIVSTTDTSVEIKSGTANQSSLWFSDTDDGNIGGIFYTHNDNGMEFRVNDSTRLTITSGGNVGIGGTPSYTLHVSGNIIAVEDSTPALRLIGGTTSFDLKSDGGVFKVRDVSSGNELYHIAAGASGYHNWYINDSLKMTLDSSGNVGIGTTSPGASKLTISDGVAGYSTANVLLQVKRNATNSNDDTSRSAIMLANNSNAFTIAYGGTTDRLRFINGSGNEQLTLLNGGNLGIGTTTPEELLDIKATSSPAIQLNQADTYKALLKLGGNDLEIRGSSGAMEFYNGTADGDSSALRMQITAAGLVGIGITPTETLTLGGVANVQLTLKSNDTSNGYSEIYFGDTDATNRGFISYSHTSDAMGIGTAASTRLTITSTGAIAVGSSSTNYGSSGQVLTSNGNASPSWTSTSGAKGEPGTTGAQGTAGSNGSNGAQGTAGTNGSNGSNGAVGSQGTNGSTGAQGAVGLNGGTGAQGATGATGGSGGTGAQGTAGTNGSNGGTGAQGATGATGGSGGTGAQGSTGSNGGTGAQGTAGSNGSNGNNGAQGTTGAQGSTGSTGSNGSNGGTGAQGTSGVATFPYSGTATFSNQIRLSNSGGYLYGGTITTRLGSRAIDMGYNGSCYFQADEESVLLA